jgi:putative endonuclease
MKQGFVYIMSSDDPKRQLYIGVTSNLARRVWQHKNGIYEGYTKKHKLHKLVYYEVFDRIIDAIQREKT